MINSKTLFIVGAGASQEVKFPAGDTFKKEITRRLDIQYEHGFERTSGDERIDEAFRRLVREKNPQNQDINPYLKASRKIRDALPQALSIDNVLDAHAEDDEVQLAGKLGVAQTILEAERKSSLFCGFGEKINQSNLLDTWYVQLSKLLTENVRKGDIGEIFDNVSFITFNYDRCIEQYLPHALANYYSISLEEARAIVSTLVIKHPYGQVGRLSAENPRDMVLFGETERVDLIAISSQIKTFTQQEANPANLEDIKSLVREAETIVFLGFGFHRMNMELLDPQTSTKVKRVFGTARGISNMDCEVVKDDIMSILHPETTIPKIVIDNTLSCYGLFETHWRSLSR